MEAVQKNWSQPQTFDGRLAAVVGQVESNVSLLRRPFWIERPAALGELAAHVDRDGMCSVEGIGGVGKSTLAALFANQYQERMLIWWIPSEDANLLLLGFEKIGRAVGVNLQHVPGRGGADPAMYRRNLARSVYAKLAKRQVGTLLVLDNVTEASACPDFLPNQARSTKVVVTTRDANLLSLYMPNVPLGPFEEAEACSYMRNRFRAARRPFDDQSTASLVVEVGLVPQQLELAAAYLQAKPQVTVAAYIDTLRSLKQGT